jgi:hypothetical protein
VALLVQSVSKTEWDVWHTGMSACKCFENFSAWRLPRKRPEAFMQIGSYGLKLYVSFFSLWNFQGLSLPGVLLECFILDAIWVAQVWYRDLGKPFLVKRKEVEKQIWPPKWQVFTKAPQKKLVQIFEVLHMKVWGGQDLDSHLCQAHFSLQEC